MVTVFDIFLFLDQNFWGTVRERSELRQGKGKEQNGNGMVTVRKNYCNYGSARIGLAVCQYDKFKKITCDAFRCKNYVIVMVIPTITYELNTFTHK